MSKVAVWMTNYNEETHIARAIGSVIGQTFTDLTLYVVDNYSTDGAPAIIADAAASDPRIVVVKPPEGLMGIELMKFCWDDVLHRGEQTYSIHLGGHDIWNTSDYLQKLVARMDKEMIEHGAAGRMPVILYTDTWQVDNENRIVGRYQDIMQTGQITAHLIPQYVITGVNSPQLFGLWNEYVRRKIPVRHCCGGWDHLVVAEAAMHGMLLFEPSLQLIMRALKPGDDLVKYGQRHFSKARLAAGDQDFREQLEWVTYLVKGSLGGIPENGRSFYQTLLCSSMFATYFALRGHNLHCVPGGNEQFMTRPEVLEIINHLGEVTRLLSELVKTSQNLDSV